MQTIALVALVKQITIDEVIDVFAKVTKLIYSKGLVERAVTSFVYLIEVLTFYI